MTVKEGCRGILCGAMLLVAGAGWVSAATLELASPFAEHMVLQRQMP